MHRGMVIRRMKLKTLLIMLLLPAAFTFAERPAGATPGFNNLAPNTYEKKEFNDNTDYLHEESLYENKKQIPEEQQDLTFTKKNYDPLKKVKEQLFTDSERINNTITAKANQLGLFSKTDQETSYAAKDSGNPIKENNKLMILYVFLLILAMGVLLGFLIPKMANQAKN